MFRILAATLLLFVPTSLAGAWAATCAGADPAIASVAVKGMTTDGSVNVYTLGGTVVNLGRSAQAKNVLQFVDIYQHGAKLDAKGVRPLKPGQSYAFSYAFRRSNDAGQGATQLTFQLDLRQPSPPGAQDCAAGNDRFRLRF